MSIDPQAVLDATPAEFAALVKRSSDADINALLGGEHRDAILGGIFGRFPELFRPEKAQGVGARINWRITGKGDGGSDTYSVIVQDGACTVEKDSDAEPDTSLMMGPADFFKLITGTGNPMMMFMSGKVKARGNVPLVMQFQNWFALPKG